MQSQQYDTGYDYDGSTPASYLQDDGRHQVSYQTENGRQNSPSPRWSSYSRKRPFFQPSEGEKLAAFFSYAFGWLSGLLFLLFGGSNRFIRFHALQCLLFFGIINVIDFIAIFIVARWHQFYLFVHAGQSATGQKFMDALGVYLPHLSVFVVLALLLLNFIAFVGWLVAMVQSARGVSFKLPVAGNIAEKVIGHRITLK